MLFSPPSSAWSDEAQGISRAAGVQRSVLTVEQADGHQGAVVLWGAALAWLERIQKHKGNSKSTAVDQY